MLDLSNETDLVGVLCMLYSIETEDQELHLLRRELVTSLGDRYIESYSQQDEPDTAENAIAVEEVFKQLDKDD